MLRVRSCCTRVLSREAPRRVQSISLCALPSSTKHRRLTRAYRGPLGAWSGRREAACVSGSASAFLRRASHAPTCPVESVTRTHPRAVARTYASWRLVSGRRGGSFFSRSAPFFSVNALAPVRAPHVTGHARSRHAQSTVPPQNACFTFCLSAGIWSLSQPACPSETCPTVQR